MKNSLPLGYLQLAFLLFVAGISFLTSGLYLNINSYKNKIFPRTYIDNFDTSGLSVLEAKTALENSKQEVEPHNIVLIVDDLMIASSSAELGAFRNYTEAVNTAYISNRDKSKIITIINLIKSFFNDNRISTKISYQEAKIDELIAILDKDVAFEGENPDISLKISNNENSIVVFKGSPGRKINLPATKEKIIERSEENTWNKGGDTNLSSLLIDALVASTSTVLTDEQTNLELYRAKSFVGETLELKAENKKYSLNDKELVALIQPLEEYNNNKIEELVSEWSEEVNRDFQNAEFDYDKNTFEVKTFKPHRDGLKINESEIKKMILDWLENLENRNLEEPNENPILDIPLERTSPSITLESTNELGINERIGFGESYYYHSIINRVHNVGITAERISLTIVPPGKEFSFNKTLGEVSTRTGYRSAYVISGGKTVLGDGGGVCQVSSTLFRSILDAGLKVTKRLQHSYRVSYYELNSQPGFDATVYAGDVDFRFVNDTESYILVYTYVESENRYMNIEIYGTNDGRTTEISNYKKWDYRSPPAPQYFPTPTLPTGVTEQVDWSVSGIKTEFTHTIKDKDGNVTNEETYYSNYRPWAAKYMVGI
ncbi:VanW family protein [Patescibacteria group bacterium]|nr:VanW family protein [Patescibacteria group bacterium]